MMAAAKAMSSGTPAVPNTILTRSLDLYWVPPIGPESVRFPWWLEGPGTLFTHRRLG